MADTASRRLRRSLSHDLTAPITAPAAAPEPGPLIDRPLFSLTSSLSAPLLCRRVVRPPAGAVLDRAQSASDEEFSAVGAPTSAATTTTKGRKHRHRRCNSLQDGRSRQQIDARRAHEYNSREGSGGAGSTVSLGKEATREEVESYVTRLESDIRQLETKLDDFNNRKRNSAQGWVGLEEKRNRKKLVEEMSRTLAARRKRLQAVYKRLQAAASLPPPCATFSSNKWCPGSDDDDDDTVPPANITKELFDACLKPQETFFGLLRRLRERQLSLDKYYYYQDCEGDSGHATDATTDDASPPAAALRCLVASRSLPILTRACTEPEGKAAPMVYASLSQPQLLPPAVCPRPHNGAGLELSYGDIRFREGVLGQGCFGAVYPASLPHTGPVAVKILKCGPRQRQSYQREVAALKRALEECPVAHPLPPPPIVRLRGYCAEPHACIVTELCEGGSIESVIRRRVKLSDRAVARVGMRVAEAMINLLALDPPIFHRDLSTANILLRKPEDYASACLADFGIAVEVIGAAETYPEGAVSTSKNGNPRYRAPEVTLTGRYNRKSDVFSFGLVLFEMITGTVPHAEVETRRVARHIADGHRPKFPKGTTADKRLRRLVKRCCLRNPDRRPDFTIIARKLAKVLDAAQD